MAIAPRIRVVPLGPSTAFFSAVAADGRRTLADLLREAPALAVDRPFDPSHLQRATESLGIDVVPRDALGGAPLYPPPGWAEPAPQDQPEPDPTAAAEAGDNDHPSTLTEAAVVQQAYQLEIDKLATFLRSRLSVLVVCEKLVAPFLLDAILKAAWLPGSDGTPAVERRLRPVVLEAPAEATAGPLGDTGPLARMRDIIENLKPDQVLVVPHLDLLGGSDKTLGREGRDLTELIYRASDRLMLAFADPSLSVPEVVAARFAVRVEVQGLPREVVRGQGRRIPVGRALVVRDEAALFQTFDPVELYKNVAGLNPIRVRQAIAYAIQVARDTGHHPGNPAPLGDLLRDIRIFKAQTADQFVVPDVQFDDIGGYDDVKDVLLRALALMMGAGKLPDEKLRGELIPRGFLFHGPPGTGKTLFAKAIANRINATIRVVSGPEITDMYVGESERKVRAVFAEARRNAPSVVVFDEFDSIAARRSGRDDGGSRAGNALVAQILTEMDGFRPDVPMLVVGTTNRLELIDDALLRPSRFQPVKIGLPNPEAARHIAEIHARHFRVPVENDLLDEIARACRGFNGDEIRSLFREACVGMHCQSPSLAPDAERFGQLVGAIHSRKDAERIQETEYRRHDPRQGRRPPSEGHVPLVPDGVGTSTAHPLSPLVPGADRVEYAKEAPR